MKRTLGLILATLLALSPVPAALGEALSLHHEASGITILVPAGFTVEDISTEDTAGLAILDESDENIAYLYDVYYAEEMAGMWLEDLSDTQIDAVAQVVANGFDSLQYEMVVEDGIYYLVMIGDDLTFAGILSLLNGWVCALYATVSDGYEMTDAAWDDLYMLQKGITYGE